MTSTAAAPAPGREFPELAVHRLPTNSTTGRHPVHRWFNFIAGFSPEFVRASIQQAGLAAGDRLLDPFAGLGTALLEANWQGLHASGFEPHPFMFDMATAKLTTRSPAAAECVADLLRSLRPVRDLEKVWPVDALRYLHKVVDRGNLELLAGARLAESACDAAAQPLYRLVVSRLLELAAGAATDGIYKAPTTGKRSVDVADGSITVLRQIREDLLSVPIGAGSSRLIPGSAEDMSALKDDSHGIAVTSPPYLNNFDFAEMTRMELYFWGYANSWGEITERVRSRLVINTTTAPTKLRRDQERWGSVLSAQFRDVVDPLRVALTEQRLTRAGKKEYDSLVYP
ncbi:MAG: hypothetical protein QOE58_579, partial [Actinomycetota bacterium]|nr:hypothetical protein [Actinomycetota bacterium]